MTGWRGWHLAWLMASYEYMISLMYHDKLLSGQARGGGKLMTREEELALLKSNGMYERA